MIARYTEAGYWGSMTLADHLDHHSAYRPDREAVVDSRRRVTFRELKLATDRIIVATAFEDPTLFSMSARENLTLGRPDATEDDIAEAVEVAQAHFVYDLPWGLDTRLGEQGMSLSGGQRQRLAIARAVVRRPDIYVFDDAFSALDVATDARLRSALRPVTREATVVVVAQRVSTILDADRIVVLDDGQVVGIGRHTELIETCPTYREIVVSQRAAEEAMA